MKYKHLLTLFITVVLFVSACSTPSAPIIAPADMYNTANAAAFTVVAETHAAIPTDTTIPPTEMPTQTSLPTETPVLLATETPSAPPTLETTATATPASQDPCNAPLTISPEGDPTKIKLENQTGAPITASIYLNLTPFGQCGYKSYDIGKGGSVIITDLPQACYSVSVYVNDPNKPTKSFGYGCINNPDQWTFVIKRDIVAFQGR